MNFPSMLQEIISLVLLLVPILWVLLSDRSHGGAKIGWLLATVFLSWLGFAAFLIATHGGSIDSESASRGRLRMTGALLIFAGLGTLLFASLLLMFADPRGLAASPIGWVVVGVPALVISLPLVIVGTLLRRKARVPGAA